MITYEISAVDVVKRFMAWVDADIENGLVCPHCSHEGGNHDVACPYTIAEDFLDNQQEQPVVEHEGTKIFEDVRTFEQLLRIHSIGKRLDDALVDDMWQAFYWSEVRLGQRLTVKEYVEMEGLAGERYIAHIDLGKDTVVVSLWDEGEVDDGN